MYLLHNRRSTNITLLLLLPSSGKELGQEKCVAKDSLMRKVLRALLIKELRVIVQK